MKCILISILLSFSLNVFGEVENEAEYRAKAAAFDNQVSAILDPPTRFFLSASSSFADKKYTQAKKDILGSFKGAHASLQEKWNGDKKSKRVPDQFVKKLLDGGMSQESFDSMVMSISGINAVDSCSLIEVAKPKAGTLEKLAVGPDPLMQKVLFGVQGKANGYVEPFSQHFFKAASAIYFLGLAAYQEQYLQKTQWIKEYSLKIDGSTQKHSLEINIELTTVAKNYIGNQVELKKAYRQMLNTAARIAEGETLTKANRKAHRGDLKGKAKKKYSKKKKRAHVSDHAARDAVKAYGIYLQKKYEYDQSTVHSHISCGSVAGSETASLFNYNKIFDLFFASAMAEDEEPVVDPKAKALFDYYLEITKANDIATNTMMITPESRLEYLSEDTVDILDRDISDTGGSYSILSTNLNEIEGIYEKFIADGGDELKDGAPKRREASENPGMLKGIGTSVVNVSDSIQSGAIEVQTRGGDLSNSESLKAMAARLRKSTEKIKPAEFTNPSGDKTVSSKTFLDEPSKYSIKDIKENALKNLSAMQRKDLASSFRNGVKADVLPAGDDEIVAVATKTKIQVKKKRSGIALPTIVDDPALTLIKNRKKLKDEIDNENAGPINEESLARLKNGSATDINGDRETTIWVIISNRYVRSGFEKLLERK